MSVLVIIDTRIGDVETLLEGLAPDAEILLLDPERDGIEQISTYLQGKGGYDALHVFSHGGPGSLQLGNSLITETVLGDYSLEFQAIGNAMTETGDILLYGCNVAAGDAGIQFIDSLAKYTGADVAASDNLTGSSIYGGDSNLEVVSGSVTTGSMLDQQLLDNYGQTLAVDDYAADTTTSGVVSVGYSVTGSIEQAYDQDWFAITLQAGHTYQIDLEGSSTSAGTLSDTYLYGVHDSSGALIANTANDDGGTGYNSQLSFTALSSGTYYIDAGAFGSNTGTYKLSVSGNFTTAGQGGIVTTDFGGDDFGRSVTLQSDGKILVAGKSATEFAIVRYNVDGSLDNSFGGDGKITTAVGQIIDDYAGDYGSSVTMQSDGKILLAGTSDYFTYYGTQSDFALVRYNADGSLDTSFSGDGKVTTAINSVTTLYGRTSHSFGQSVTVQTDGKILVAGRTYDYLSLARYNADGSLDTSFDGDGVVTTDIGSSSDSGQSVTVQSDSKILVAGYSDGAFALVRYNTNGSLDTSFDGDGVVTTDIGSSSGAGQSVTVQTDGKILVAGYSGSDFALIRYNANGSLDSSFDGDGVVTTDLGSSSDGGQSVTVQSDDKILVAGYSGSDFALVRYNADGSLDTTFGISSGGVNTVQDVYLSTDQGSIYVWNMASGVVTLAAQTGLPLTDIATDTDGSLYGITADTLYSLDLQTGGFTEIGLLNSLLGELYFGVSALTDANGFDISPTGVGRISSGNNFIVATVDLETGHVSNEFGPLGSASSAGDLWYTNDNNYWMTTTSSTLVEAGPTSSSGEGVASSRFIASNAVDGLIGAPGGATLVAPDTLVGFVGKTAYALGEGQFALGTGLATLNLDGNVTGATALRGSGSGSTDTEAPTVTSFSPLDEATDVAVDSNIVVTFSELIQRGSGSIFLKTLLGATVENFDAATSSNLTLSGNILTINPTSDLAANSAYMVDFAAGAIKDLAGNDYVGTSSYNFTTAGQGGVVTTDSGLLSLALSNGTWTDQVDGSSVATGDLIIGLKDGHDSMISVSNGSYQLDNGHLFLSGSVSSIIGGVARPLFTGQVNLSTNDASGTIDWSTPIYGVAGIKPTFTEVNLANDDVRLHYDIWGLPGAIGTDNLFMTPDVLVIDDLGVHLGLGESLPLPVISFDLYDALSIESSDLTIRYDAFEDQLIINGGFDIWTEWPGVPSLHAELGGSGIVIHDGEISDLALDISLSDFTLKGLGIKDVLFSLDTGANTISGQGEVTVPFGMGFANEGYGFSAEFGFTLQPFVIDSVSVATSLVDPGIPIGTTGWFVTALGGGIANLSSANTDPWLLSGGVGLAGPDDLIEMTLTGELDINHVSGAVTGHFIDDDLLRFDGSAVLDWSRNQVSLDSVANFADGFITGDFNFQSDFDLNIISSGTVEVSLGGLFDNSFWNPLEDWGKASGNYSLLFSNDDNFSNDYVAGWVTTQITWPFQDPEFVTKGAKFTFDGQWSTFGAEDVALYASWIVDESISDLLVTVSWENAATSPVHTQVVVYDDLAKTQIREVIQELDYVVHNIAVIEDWSSDYAKVIYIAAPTPGVWDVEVVNPEGLGEIIYAATTSLADSSLSVDAISQQDNVLTIDYTAINPNGASNVNFFADDNGEGFDGRLIGTAQEMDGTGQIVLHMVGFAPGDYWIHAIQEDGQSIPDTAYAATSIHLDAWWGSDGNDLLVGMDETDTIHGLDGDDTLVGGAGIDTLGGGAGADVFRDTSAGLNGDELIDFSIDDLIEVTGIRFNDIRYNPSTGALEFDTAGDGSYATTLNLPDNLNGVFITQASELTDTAYTRVRLAADNDGDGVPDESDNAIFVPNPDQRDTDGDGYGNVVDADLNQDMVVDFFDLSMLDGVFGTDDANADFNGDGSVDFFDLSIMDGMFGLPPGPSYVDAAGAAAMTLAEELAAQTLADFTSSLEANTPTAGAEMVL